MIKIDNENYLKVMKSFENSKVSIVSYDETLHRLVLRLYNKTNKMFLFIILLGVNEIKGNFRWNNSDLVYKKASKDEYFDCLLDNKNDFEIFFDGGMFMIKGKRSNLLPEDFTPSSAKSD